MRGIDCVDIDVTTAPGAMEELEELTLGSMQVPVLVAEDGSVRIAGGG